jgi:N-acetylglucosamine-6-sulfatase
MKKQFHHLTLAALLLTQLCFAQEKKPNIIFIFTDDLANRAISAYDGTINKTPNIDRIAKEGAIFRNSFCGNSICGPSRATILTGKHSHKNGVTGNASPWDSTRNDLLPLYLKNAGYQTALIGKWHLNSNPGKAFDYWKILMGAGRQGFYYNPDFVTSTGEYVMEKGYSTDLITNHSINWLNQHAKEDKPYVLFVQYKAPHVPRMPPLRLLGKYKNDTIPEPATLLDNYATRERYAAEAKMPVPLNTTLPLWGEYDPSKNIYTARMTKEELEAYHKVKDEETKELRRLKASGLEGDALRRHAYQLFIKDYIRIVNVVDENVGRLLRWLDENPSQKENTIVIFSSDQSYFTGEHGWAEKRFMYDQGMKMPLLMRWPAKIKPGTEVNALVQNIDYAPTLLAAAAVKVPDDMQGKSLLPVATDKKDDKDFRDYVYYHYYDHGDHGVPRHDGIRGHRYKLIHYYTENRYEMYDLEKDPYEVANVYGKADYKKVQDELLDELKDRRDDYDVPAAHFKPPYVPKQ